jgi:hypothetical protein
VATGRCSTLDADPSELAGVEGGAAASAAVAKMAAGAAAFL